MLGSRWPAAAVVVALAALVAAAYSNALRGPFVFDDREAVVENAAIQVEELSLGSLEGAAFGPPYVRRPVANLTFALNHRFGGLDPFGYHVANVAIHVGSALGVLCFLRLLVGERGRALAAPAAFLWALHPVQTEAVTYVTQRMASLSGCLDVWALAAYLAAWRVAGWRRGALLAGAAALGLLALGTKEVAVLLPAAVLVVEAWFPQAGSGRPRRVAAAAGGLLLAGAAAVLAMPGAWSAAREAAQSLASGETLAGRDFSARERLLTEARVVAGTYPSLLAFPAPGRLNLDHDVEVSRGLASPPGTLLALLALLAGGALAIRWRRRFPVASFAAIWYLVHLSVESTVVGLELAFEHRLYVASIGPALAAAALVEFMAGGRAGRRFVLAALLAAALAGATRARNEAWATELSLYEDCARKSPDKARAQRNYGVALARAGRPEDAIRRLKRAGELEPDHPSTLSNLGWVLLGTGRAAEAAAVFERAVEVAPTAEFWEALGIARSEAGAPETARAAFEEALRLDPAHAGARRHLAELEFGAARAEIRAGRWAAAERRLARARELAPGDPAIENAYGTVLGELGRFDEAVAVLEELARRRPDLLASALNLAATHERRGDALAALEVYERALERAPDSAEVHARLARFHAEILFDPGERTLHARRALEIDPGHPDREALARWAR